MLQLRDDLHNILLHSNILALAHLDISLEAHGEQMGIISLEKDVLLQIFVAELVYEFYRYV